MEHIPVTELQKALTKAQEIVHIGSRYTHFKNPNVEYVVTGLGILEATNQIAVLSPKPKSQNV
jgi:hypothetical protein